MHRLGINIKALSPSRPKAIAVASAVVLRFLAWNAAVAEPIKLVWMLPQPLDAGSTIVRVACSNEQGYSCASTARECYAHGSNTHGGMHGQPLATKCGQEWDACLARCGGLPPGHKRTDY
jgi:hypothetical protein